MQTVSSLQTKFQLTRLLRGATHGRYQRAEISHISTHTPLARRDFSSLCVKMTVSRFQLTRLLRGATNALFTLYAYNFISTHTPLARRDRACYLWHRCRKYFNSHASCEARLGELGSCTSEYNFNSHASCEARHFNIVGVLIAIIFQLTRLLRGATKSRSA